jgi:subtilase family serine protease
VTTLVIARPRVRRMVGAAAGLAILVGLVLVAPTGATALGATSTRPPRAVAAVTTSGPVAPSRYYTLAPACAPAQAGHMSCLALRRVAAASARVPGAIRSDVHTDAYPAGPAGGFTPSDIAKAYGEHPATQVTQTVGIVDAYDDPNLLSDLNAFDAYYGLPAETASTFRKVSQTGSTTALPNADRTGWAAEEILDAEAVRGMCHSCTILLVEANTSTDADLGAAVDEAVALGANEVAVSYGSAERSDSGQSAAVAADYNHPGVVIAAATGDHGYYGWDNANYSYSTSSTPPPGTQTTSSDAPDMPASLNTVVAVGATTLQLNDDGTRSGEAVWNDNGPIDSTGLALAAPQGASGGGCSTEYTAQPWQSNIANYASTGCGSKRLATDISIVGDPNTGFDIYDSYPTTSSPACTPPACWYTYGGTSLSAPLIAAIWATVGGSGGVPYPSLSLYGHLKSSVGTLNDVTVGGNGYCDGSSPAACQSVAGSAPNTSAEGILDCAWVGTTSTLAVGTRACEAATGYDGASGVGTPNTAAAFRAMNPTGVITTPATITHSRSATISGATSSDPFPGGSITADKWYFGDRTGATGPKPAHTYAKAGRYTITLQVTDNYGRSATVTKAVTVK